MQNNVYVYPDAEHSIDTPKAFISKPYCANSDGASRVVLPGERFILIIPASLATQTFMSLDPVT